MGPRSVNAGIAYGMNVFFTGNMWGKKAEGRVIILDKNDLSVLDATTTSGRIVNQWLQ